MKVNLTLDLTDRDRYVIAKHYGSARARATRKEVRRFIAGAVTWALREQADGLRKRQRTVAARLMEPAAPGTREPEPMAEPRERQLDLLVGPDLG